MSDYRGLPLIAATFFFAFQIYLDFSGYTDIALGLARILGFKLLDNFRQPYFSLSITEFWQRWHISLSTWIRDYLYFPFARKMLRLTQGRFPRLAQLIVSVIVMGLVGLWHGAAWTFVIWGTLHGIFLGVEGWLQARHNKTAEAPTTSSPVATAIRWAITFGLVCFAWIFFRANSVSDAFYVVAHLFQVSFSQVSALTSPFGDSRAQFALVILLIALALGVDAAARLHDIDTWLNLRPRWTRWAIYYGMTASILLLGIWGKQEFIYFKF